MDAIISETRHQIITNFYRQNSSEGMRFTDKHFKKNGVPKTFRQAVYTKGYQAKSLEALKRQIWAKICEIN